MISYYALLFGVCGAAPAPKLAVLWPEGHKWCSSVELFSHPMVTNSLADILLERQPNIETLKATVKPVAEFLLCVDRFKDLVRRGTTIMARDYSCGPASIHTDLTNLLDGTTLAPENALSLSPASRKMLRHLRNLKIIDSDFGAGELLRAVVSFGQQQGTGHQRSANRVYYAEEVLVAMMMIALVLDAEEARSFLNWDVMYVPACFFGSYVVQGVQKGLVYYIKEPARKACKNTLGLFILKRRMHMSLSWFQMKVCKLLEVMQRQSQLDPDLQAICNDNFPGVPEERWTWTPTLLQPLEARVGTATDPESEDEDEGVAESMVPEDLDEADAPTVPQSFLDARPLGTRSQFLRDWEPKASREVSKAFHAATPSAKDKAHLKQLGLSEDEFPRERLTLVQQLKAKKNEIAALEQNGIAGVEPGKKYALVVYLGSAQMFDTWFPPVAIFDVPCPIKFHFEGSLKMQLATYLVIRQTGLHALFMLAMTCRNHHGSRKFGVAHGKFILSGKDKIQLFAPPIAKLILYIFWFWWWIWWWWPALILGFVWVVALYEVREDGQGNSTGHLVEDSGAWRPGACSWTRSTFPEKVYFHKKKESYELADNKATMVDDGDDGVLDVLDARVLLDGEFLHDLEPEDLYREARVQYVPT